MPPHLREFYFGIVITGLSKSPRSHPGVSAMGPRELRSSGWRCEAGMARHEHAPAAALVISTRHPTNCHTAPSRWASVRRLDELPDGKNKTSCPILDVFDGRLPRLWRLDLGYLAADVMQSSHLLPAAGSDSTQMANSSTPGSSIDAPNATRRGTDRSSNAVT